MSKYDRTPSSKTNCKTLQISLRPLLVETYIQPFHKNCCKPRKPAKHFQFVICHWQRVQVTFTLYASASFLMVLSLVVLNHQLIPALSNHWLLPLRWRQLHQRQWLMWLVMKFDLQPKNGHSYTETHVILLFNSIKCQNDCTWNSSNVPTSILHLCSATEN